MLLYSICDPHYPQLPLRSPQISAPKQFKFLMRSELPNYSAHDCWHIRKLLICIVRKLQLLTHNWLCAQSILHVPQALQETSFAYISYHQVPMIPEKYVSRQGFHRHGLISTYSCSSEVRENKQNKSERRSPIWAFVSHRIWRSDSIRLIDLLFPHAIRIYPFYFTVRLPVGISLKICGSALH